MFSIKINGIDTWSVLKLIPTEQPFIQPPKIKKTIIDIPGWHGSIDLSKALTGSYAYEDRLGTLSFYITDDTNPIIDIITDLQKRFHGVTAEIILDTEPNYKYVGTIETRFEIKEFTSLLHLDYKLEPFKLSTTETVLSLVLDNTGGTKSITISQDQVGIKPTKPLFVSTAQTALSAKIVNSYSVKPIDFTIQNGSSKPAGVILAGLTSSITVNNNANATIQIKFNKGVI